MPHEGYWLATSGLQHSKTCSPLPHLPNRNSQDMQVCETEAKFEKSEFD